MSRSPSLSFRPDVEGLRAVAIVAVVAAHAGVPFLQGGFVGVDVFFVLSGFLISGLLVNELEESGRVHLARFYARRFRRLLPALLVVLLIASLLAVLLLAPGEQAGQARTALYVPWWLTNMRFALAKLDYFGRGAESELFLHTWSLGVEEQFYLIWPALLWALWKSASTTPDPRQGLARPLMLVLCGGFLLSLVLGETLQQLAFYTMISRAWQFALGALVFLRGEWVLRVLSQRSGWPVQRLASIGCLGGAALIGVSVALLGRGEHYPGAWALAPSMGAGLILMSGHHATNLSANVLRSGLAQWLGRMSYGWYLWHWPLLVLFASWKPYAGWQVNALVGLAALLLAAVSFYLVEHPVRRARRLDPRPGQVVVASLVLMAASTLFVWLWRSEALDWSSQPEQQRIAQVSRDLPAIYALGCDQWYHSASVIPCVEEAEGFRRTAVILGDSVVLQWYDAMRAAFPVPEWRVVVLTKSACPMVHARFHYARLGRPFYECEQWRQRVLAYLAELSPDILITGSGAGYDIAGDELEEGSLQMIGALSQTTRLLLLLQPTPILGEDPIACMARRDWRPEWLSGEPCMLRPSPEAIAPERAANKAVSAQLDNVEVLDLNHLICERTECAASRAGVIIYRDSQHLSREFVLSVSPLVDQQIRELGNREDIDAEG